ncbi:MAG: PQQ-binding-like beta-propeller repeat protein [Gemmatimonadetes bacterium]|nr:PQQ-binding-like beta-propeller repeat protein [Gemmatimonadota bacterium]
MSRVWFLMPWLMTVLPGIAVSASTIDVAPAFSADRLTRLPRGDWVTNGGNLYNQRYSPLDQIDRNNVKHLKGVWRTRLNGSGVGPPHSGEAQPIVYQGVVYIVTGADDVFAISVETGEILWTYEAGLDPEIDTVCCGWTSRGVGMGDGKIFVGQLDGRLVALNQATGEPQWTVQAERWQAGLTITSAPLYYNGLVITGFAGAEYGVRGRVKAYDADDGKLVWTFYTIPSPGEIGSDTWPKDSDVWRHGGATVWQTPAVDSELGLLYFSTGNPGPDFNGSVRAGDNLFSISIVAVDVATGEYRWHYQQVHHDIWDYDSPSPVVLFDIDLAGKTRKAIAEVSKTGWVYILDRITGQPLIGIEERAVPQDPRQATSATQPYPIGDAVVPQFIDIPPEVYSLTNEGRIFTPYWTDGMVAKPSTLGGNNWPPASLDPTKGILYVCANDSIGYFMGGDRDFETPEEGEQYHGGEFGAEVIPNNGIFAAMDMRTNKIVWRRRWKDTCYSGSVATAGDLVFTGRNDGRFVALDANDGKPLWEFQTGAGVNAPASVFEHQGDQYVVVYSAGNLFANSPYGDSVWLFSLQGEIDPVDPPIQIGGGIPATGEADVANGEIVYSRFCVACHGEDGRGGHGGGAPFRQSMAVDTAIMIVSRGFNDMPTFSTTLSPEQIRDVSTYVAIILTQED